MDEISAHIYEIPVEKGLVLYHILNGRLLYLDEDETKTYMDKENEDLLDRIHSYLSYKRIQIERPVYNSIQLTLLVSHRCNLACSYCSASEINQDNRLMDVTVAERAIEIFGADSSSIFFFGGEPLLNKKLIKGVVSFTKKNLSNKPRFAIQTNATLLTSDFVKFLKENDFALTTSLDGPGPDLRLFPSRTGSRDIVLKRIGLLRQEEIPFSIEATYTSEHLKNKISLVDVFKYLISLGAGNVHIMPVAGDPEGAIRDEQLNALASGCEKLISYIVNREGIKGLSKLYLANNIIERFNKGRNDICFAGVGKVVVDAAGNVYPCQHMMEDRFFMGNVMSDEFPNEKFDSVRKGLIETTKDTVEPCRSCWARYICPGCYGYGIPPSRTICTFTEATARAIITQLVGATDDKTTV